MTAGVSTIQALNRHAGWHFYLCFKLRMITQCICQAIMQSAARHNTKLLPTEALTQNFCWSINYIRGIWNHALPIIGRLQILRLPFLNENMKTIGFFKVPVLTQYLLSSLPKREKQLRVHQNALTCMRITWYPTIIQISTLCNDYGIGYV